MGAAALATKLGDLVDRYCDLAKSVTADPEPGPSRDGLMRLMGEIEEIGDRSARVLGVAEPDWKTMRTLAGLDS